MKHFEIYNPGKTYISPVGETQNQDWIAKNRPGMLEIPYVVEIDESGKLMLGYWPIGHLRSLYNMDHKLTDEEVVSAFSDVENAPQETNVFPDSSERLAAAQEFDNMMKYKDVSVDVLVLNAERGLWSKTMVQTGIATIASSLSDDDSLALQPLAKKWSDVLSLVPDGLGKAEKV